MSDIGLKIEVNDLSQLSIPHDSNLPEFVIFFFFLGIQTTCFLP